jgi:hypothetical protein
MKPNRRKLTFYETGCQSYNEVKAFDFTLIELQPMRALATSITKSPLTGMPFDFFTAASCAIIATKSSNINSKVRIAHACIAISSLARLFFNLYLHLNLEGTVNDANRLDYKINDTINHTTTLISGFIIIMVFVLAKERQFTHQVEDIVPMSP